uniref:Uncharacterized protein n=1 Tax=Romanomermis culicivorax TaxID=13658 RepID=A0A915HP44_ROMCU
QKNLQNAETNVIEKHKQHERELVIKRKEIVWNTFIILKKMELKNLLKALALLFFEKGQH